MTVESCKTGVRERGTGISGQSRPQQSQSEGLREQSERAGNADAPQRSLSASAHQSTSGHQHFAVSLSSFVIEACCSDRGHVQCSSSKLIPLIPDPDSLGLYPGRAMIPKSVSPFTKYCIARATSSSPMIRTRIRIPVSPITLLTRPAPASTQ